MDRRQILLKFRSELISGILINQGDIVRTTIQSIEDPCSVRIAQGYGVASTVPLRTLAYCVPLLRLMRQMPTAAKAEFYTATGGVLRANPGYDERTIRHSSELIRILLREYAKRFHGEVTIVDVFDEPDIKVDPEISAAIDYLFPSAVQIMEGDSALKGFIANRGGYAALRYVVEHALYMRDPITGPGGTSLPFLVPDMRRNPADGNIIMIGGPAEKIFYKMRKGFLERVGSHKRWKSHQFFTPIGNPPTYHPQSYEPYANIVVDQYKRLELADVLGMAKAAGSGPFRDWLILLQDTSGVERFTIASNKQDKNELSVLEKGLANLLDWLATLSLR